MTWTDWITPPLHSFDLALGWPYDPYGYGWDYGGWSTAYNYGDDGQQSCNGYVTQRRSVPVDPGGFAGLMSVTDYDSNYARFGERSGYLRRYPFGDTNLIEITQSNINFELSLPSADANSVQWPAGAVNVQFESTRAVLTSLAVQVGVETQVQDDVPNPRQGVLEMRLWLPSSARTSLWNSIYGYNPVLANEFAGRSDLLARTLLGDIIVPDFPRHGAAASGEYPIPVGAVNDASNPSFGISFLDEFTISLSWAEQFVDDPYGPEPALTGASYKLQSARLTGTYRAPRYRFDVIQREQMDLSGGYRERTAHFV